MASMWQCKMARINEEGGTLPLFCLPTPLHGVMAKMAKSS